MLKNDFLGESEVKVSQSYPTLCDPMDCSGMGSLSLPQGISPTQGLNLAACIAGRFFIS